MSTDSIKKLVGERAATFVENGMVVGLGTGSTAFYFIQALIQRCKQGLSIKAVSSSIRSLELAKAGGIPLIDINSISSIDITVDGADEIDNEKRMIKGGGGALVREKIVASMSKELVVIIDESKLVEKLGKCKLPVEILPFGATATTNKLNRLGYEGSLRYDSIKNNVYTTDNGNWIFDIHFPSLPRNIEEDHEKIIHLPGVIDTGFFNHLAGRVIVGFNDGQVVVKP